MWPLTSRRIAALTSQMLPVPEVGRGLREAPEGGDVARAVEVRRCRRGPRRWPVVSCGSSCRGRGWPRPRRGQILAGLAVHEERRVAEDLAALGDELVVRGARVRRGDGVEDTAAPGPWRTSPCRGACRRQQPASRRSRRARPRRDPPRRSPRRRSAGESASSWVSPLPSWQRVPAPAGCCTRPPAVAPAGCGRSGWRRGRARRPRRSRRRRCGSPTPGRRGTTARPQPAVSAGTPRAGRGSGGGRRTRGRARGRGRGPRRSACRSARRRA